MINKMMVKSGFILLISLISSVAQAGGILNMAFATGGDTLAERSDGVSLDAGGGILFEMGYEMWQPQSPLAFRFLMGFKSDSVTGRDASGRDTTAKISSLPVHLMAFYQMSDFVEMGAGLAYHMNPKYKDPGGGTSNFDNATGFAFEFDYILQTRLMLGLRYTSITYKGAPLISGNQIINEVNADNFAISVGYMF